MSGVKVITVTRKQPVTVPVPGATRIVVAQPSSPAQIETVHKQTTLVTVTKRAATQVQVPGIQGPAGRDGDKTFYFTQSAPSTEWVIVHNLGKFPAVVVVDSNGEQVVGTPNYLSDNALTITFAAPFSGDAYLN